MVERSHFFSGTKLKLQIIGSSATNQKYGYYIFTNLNHNVCLLYLTKQMTIQIFEEKGSICQFLSHIPKHEDVSHLNLFIIIINFACITLVRT